MRRQRQARCAAAQQQQPTLGADDGLGGWRSSISSTVESSLDETTAASSRQALADLGIAELQPEQLFDDAHVQAWGPLLAAYMPVGVLLAVLRMAAWVGGIALDAAWLERPGVVDAYMALLGVRVEWRGQEHIPQQQVCCRR